MAANPAIFRGSADIDDSAFEPINATSLVCSGLLKINTDNTGTVTVRYAEDTDHEVVLEAGSSWPLVNVDLAKIELQASAANQGYQFVGDTYRGFPG
jgi:hypothetical protein